MTRRFGLLTPPVRDNERVVASAQIEFLGARDFDIEIAMSIRDWFEIEQTLFDGTMFAVHVRRRGTSPAGIRFCAMVTCKTDDSILQRRELQHVYWPPPESELFVTQNYKIDETHIPELPIFLSSHEDLDIHGLEILLTNVGEPLTALFEANSGIDGLSHYIPFEAPIRVDTPRDKIGREWVHFSGAREDLQRGDVDLLNGAAISCVPDPPDIRVQQGRNTLGIELAQFVNGDRRQLVAGTDRLRGIIAKTPPSKLSHLRNQLVLIGFPTPRGLPPRELMQDEFESLVQKLIGAESVAVTYSDPADLRNGFTVRIMNSPFGQESIGIFPLPAAPRGVIGRRYGFDLAASYTLIKTRRMVADELAQLIYEKDMPGNDVLLISAGAPSFGSCLISDEVLVKPQLLEFMTFPQPRHLQRVLLHRWTNRDVYELTPDLRCLVPPVRHAGEGGVSVVGPRAISETTWRGRCCCGQDKAFRDCHGGMLDGG